MARFSRIDVLCTTTASSPIPAICRNMRCVPPPSSIPGHTVQVAPFRTEAAIAAGPNGRRSSRASTFAVPSGIMPRHARVAASPAATRGHGAVAAGRHDQGDTTRRHASRQDGGMIGVFGGLDVADDAVAPQMLQHAQQVLPAPAACRGVPDHADGLGPGVRHEGVTPTGASAQPTR